MYFKRAIVLLLFLSNFYCAAQAVILSEEAKVSIITCDTGNEVYSLFGHTAIRIRDDLRNIDVVYNYGLFDFGTPNFIGKFSKGDLQYYMGVENFNEFMSQYQYERRTVFEQELNLSTANKQALYDRLNTDLFSDRRFYTYKFIDRNCTNMAVDVINDVLGGKVIYKQKNTDITYRETLYPFFDGHFYEQLGTSIIFGTKVDERATLLFLPGELMENLDITKYKGQPLAQDRQILLGFKKQESASLINNVYSFLLLLLVVVLVRNKIVTSIYFTIVGLIGLFFSVAGWYSLHEELAYNYNALLFNPFVLLLVYFYLSKNILWIKRTAIFTALSTAVYFIVIIDKIHLLIVLPIVVTNLILLSRMLMKKSKTNTASEM